MRAAVLLLSTLSLLSFFSSPRAEARPLRIIHTNDLHSHLDHASERTRGGYAAVKATIDQLKWESKNQGIETLVLDAGDFSEDSQYFLPSQGLYSWLAMNAMGYDAVAIGNHDWLAGPKALDDVVGRVDPSFAFLGANFIFTWAEKNLVQHMRQFAEFTRAGARVAVYGLTTDDWQYSWMSNPGFVFDPVQTAQEDLPAIRSRNDFVIALTHLGTGADRRLIKRVSGIDLVVGGHSHTSLKTPLIATAPDGRTVPIVQSGMHGRYVGDLLIDIEPGKPLQVLGYRLVPVYSNGPKDEAMLHLAGRARAALEREYGREWLNEVVGYAEVPLENAYYKGETTAWSRFVADAIREAGDAEAAVDATQFEGFDQPAGPINREQLFVLYPRIFEFEKRFGWTVWTTQVRGWILKFALEQVIKQDLPVHTSGITYEQDDKGNIWNVRVNGQPISGMRNYKVALPEGIIRGAFGLTRYLGIVFKDVQDTQVPIWFATEAKLRREGSIKALKH